MRRSWSVINAKLKEAIHQKVAVSLLMGTWNLFIFFGCCFNRSYNARFFCFFSFSLWISTFYWSFNADNSNKITLLKKKESSIMLRDNYILLLRVFLYSSSRWGYSAVVRHKEEILKIFVILIFLEVCCECKRIKLKKYSRGLVKLFIFKCFLWHKLRKCEMWKKMICETNECNGQWYDRATRWAFLWIYWWLRNLLCLFCIYYGVIIWLHLLLLEEMTC